MDRVKGMLVVIGAALVGGFAAWSVATLHADLVALRKDVVELKGQAADAQQTLQDVRDELEAIHDAQLGDDQGDSDEAPTKLPTRSRRGGQALRPGKRTRTSENGWPSSRQAVFVTTGWSSAHCPSSEPRPGPKRQRQARLHPRGRFGREALLHERDRVEKQRGARVGHRPGTRRQRQGSFASAARVDPSSSTVGRDTPSPWAGGQPKSCRRSSE
jgi:hypothetical protein